MMKPRTLEIRRRTTHRPSAAPPLGALASCLVLIISCAGERPAPEVQMRAARIVTHRVESDETWQSIARDFYGDGRRAAELARDNGMKVEAQPLAGSAVRVSLSGRDVKRLERRLDAAREYNEGLDLASKGSYAAGAAKFEEALKLDPSFRDASFNLALCYGKLSLHKRAAEILEELVATHSESNEYRYALGASRFGAGDLGGAEKTFKEVLAREPAHGNALFSLAVTLEKRGKQAEAAARFRQYLLLEPAGEWAEAARSHLEGLARAGGGAR